MVAIFYTKQFLKFHLSLIFLSAILKDSGIWEDFVPPVSTTYFPIGKPLTLNTIAGNYFITIHYTQQISLLIALTVIFCLEV